MPALGARPKGRLPLTERPAWRELGQHFQEVRDLELKHLFAADQDRARHLAAEACDIYLDYSKNRITEVTLRLLVKLARECGLPERIEAMFSGQRIKRKPTTPSSAHMSWPGVASSATRTSNGVAGGAAAILARQRSV